MSWCFQNTATHDKVTTLLSPSPPLPLLRICFYTILHLYLSPGGLKSSCSHSFISQIKSVINNLSGKSCKSQQTSSVVFEKKLTTAEERWFLTESACNSQHNPPRRNPVRPHITQLESFPCSPRAKLSARQQGSPSLEHRRDFSQHFWQSLQLTGGEDSLSAIINKIGSELFRNTNKDKYPDVISKKGCL